jgi:hypothetical protein
MPRLKLLLVCVSAAVGLALAPTGALASQKVPVDDSYCYVTGYQHTICNHVTGYVKAHITPSGNLHLDEYLHYDYSETGDNFTNTVVGYDQTHSLEKQGNQQEIRFTTHYVAYYNNGTFATTCDVFQTYHITQGDHVQWVSFTDVCT